MIFMVVGFLLFAAVVVLVRSYRTPENRQVISTILTDRFAVKLGVLAMVLCSIPSLVDLRFPVLSIPFGMLVTILVHRRRQNVSKS